MPVQRSANHPVLAPIVDLGYVKYQGIALDSGVNEYLGMRYAEPPVGNLRWRAPQDLCQTNITVQNATQVGLPGICPIRLP